MRRSSLYNLFLIGINIQISQEDANVWFDNLLAGNMQMGIAALGIDMVGVEDMVSMLLPIDEGGYGFNVSDELLNMARTAPYIEDNAERHTAIIDTLNLMAAECPWIPLYDTPMYCVYRSTVGNVNDCSCATYVFYFGDMTYLG